jgi:hypothetical protein
MAATTELAPIRVDAFGRDYLRLALSIDRHFPGYVDAYYGPPDIKAALEAAEPIPLAELQEQLAALQAAIPSGDAERSAYLGATLRAMACSLQLLAGEPVDYLEEVRRIYDIDPQLVDESVFEAAHAQLDDALPPGKPGASLADRMEAQRRLFEIDAPLAPSLLAMVQTETRTRTLSHIDLPAGEAVEVTLTSGQPWSAYNWYRGGFRSHIEFNTDIPLSAVMLLGLFAHEGYPGHHTEAVLKEQRLVRDKGYAEQTVMLLHSPAAVIAEGIATTALEMIFRDGGDHQWTRDALFPAAGLSDAALAAADQLPVITEAMKALRRVTGNAAIRYHNGRFSREQAIDYIQTYGLTSPARAEKSFSFLSHPLYRSYGFTYTEGYDLIDRQPDKGPVFRRLLSEQVLPSQLASSQQL